MSDSLTVREGEVEVTYHGRLVIDCVTSKQRVRILETKEFGRMLFIDDDLMTSEADAKIYNEGLTHPMCDGGTGLIVGGGTMSLAVHAILSGACDKVKVVEYDEDLIAICAELYPPSRKARRFKSMIDVEIADAGEFLKETFLRREHYDFICIDLQDTAEWNPGKDVDANLTMMGLASTVGDLVTSHVGDAGKRSALANHWTSFFSSYEFKVSYVPSFLCPWAFFRGTSKYQPCSQIFQPALAI